MYIYNIYVYIYISHVVSLVCWNRDLAATRHPAFYGRSGAEAQGRLAESSDFAACPDELQPTLPGKPVANDCGLLWPMCELLWGMVGYFGVWWVDIGCYRGSL